MKRSSICLLPLLALPLAAAPATGEGFRFRATTHAEGTASAAISMADLEVEGRVDGSKARIEVQKSRNPLLPQGDVLLTGDGGRTFTLLDPAKKTSAAWTPPDRAKAPASSRPSMVRVRFENPEVRKLEEKPGEKIAGHATRYSRFRISYVAAVDVMGSEQKTATTRVEELWTAADLTDAGFGAWLRKDSSPTGNDELDRKVSAELSAEPGTPLKRVTTTTWKDSSGKDQTVKSTIAVTELKKQPVPAALFQAPPGFRDLSAEKR